VTNISLQMDAHDLTLIQRGLALVEDEAADQGQLFDAIMARGLSTRLTAAILDAVRLEQLGPPEDWQ
jgi:hypothetical protein